MSTSNELITQLSLAERISLLNEYSKLDRHYTENKILTVFDTDEIRQQYPKHIEFFGSGSDCTQRLFLGGNRTGKTFLGAFEVACHLTGRYPEWWTGRRFAEATSIWVCGISTKTVRDILQLELMGDPDNYGTGMIPKSTITKIHKAQGIANAIDVVDVRHISGGVSNLQFRSYESGRKTFQGTAKDVILLDEECPEEVYQESLLRLMTKNGIMLLTFTPLMGLTPLIQSFMNTDQKASKKTITVTWDEVGHLSTEQKEMMLASLPPHQRDARSKGIPSLGSGAIYPVPESDFLIKPFEIPAHWRRLWALDVGWNNTAACWVAIDPDTNTHYVYSDYKQGGEQPFVHANTIKSRGDWIPGVIDPASRGRSQADGRSIIDQYKEAGLEISLANNAVEAGIYRVWEGLSTGKIKIFNSCVGLMDEFRLYHRNEKGAVVKTHDHIMDAFRYAIMTSDRAIQNKPKTYNSTNYYNVGSHSRTSL